ncbi:hypothetical protein AB3H07_25655, partial [Escherichia coli]
YPSQFPIFQTIVYFSVRVELYRIKSYIEHLSNVLDGLLCDTVITQLFFPPLTPPYSVSVPN